MHFLFILQLRSPEPANHSTDVIAKRLSKIEAACREKKIGTRVASTNVKKIPATN
jgi:hypothetical protein